MKLSFAGNLKTVALTDVFQLIFSSKKTGDLLLTKGKSHRHIYFKSGMLIFATSSDEQDLFGNTLLKRGRITKQELDEVLKSQKEGKKIGAVLVERNLFTREEIIDCLKIQIEDIVYGLFGWKDGEFQFEEGKVPPPETIQVELNPMNIIMEGMRRIDEWGELKKILPADDAALEMAPEPPAPTDSMKLTRNEFTVLALIGSGKRLSKVIEESYLDQFLTCKAIGNLLQTGLLKIGKTVKETKSTEKEQQELIELLAQVYVNNLTFIFDNLKEKLGVKGHKVIYETFEYNKMFYPILNQTFAGRDGEINFDLFLRFYNMLPEEARLWRLVSTFNCLLNDYLIAVQKNLGEKIYRRVLSEIKINIQSLINKNRQLAIKYGLEEEFSRAFRDR